MKKLLLLCLPFFLAACASDSKDIYFRSRLPTGENPHFKPQGQFGVNIELESERATHQITKNLVSDFDFKYKQSESPFSQNYGEMGLVGADISLSYTAPIPFPIELAVSSDFAEMKVGLFGFQGGQKSNFFFMINGGYYKSTAYIDDGSCKGRVCWPGTKENSTVSDSIRTDQSGTEKKVGGNLGYFLDNGNAIYLSYNWMDYHYKASATQSNSPFQTIDFDQSMYGRGVGLGYMFKFEENNAISFSADNVTVMSFRENFDQIVYGLKLNL